MRWGKYMRVLLILLICLFFSTANAVEKSKGTTKAYSLGEVVVTSAMPGEDTIATIEITDLDIEKRNAKTLDKALELLPGVDVSSGGQGIPRVNIRGFRSRHTLLLLNGIPINSTYDHQFDPHIIPTENISKIKVSYGSHSVLYGQGGLAGVINIITKQGTSGLNLNASGEITDRGNHYSKATVSGGKDNMDFFASLSQKHSKGFLLPENFDPTGFEDGGIRENSDDKRISFFTNVGVKLGDDVELGLTLEKSNGEFGTPPTTLDDNTDPFYKSPKYDRTEDFDTFSTQVSLGYDPRGMLAFKAWGFINTYEEDLARYDDNTYTTLVRKNSYTSTDKTVVTGGTFQTSLDFDASGIVSLSVSGQADEYTSDGAKVEANNNPAVPFHKDYDLSLYSTALEYKVRLLSRLDMIMGYSHHWQTRDVGEDDDKASYMIGSSLKLTDTTTMRASYAKKIRFPSIKQLYDTENGGNPDLKPEQSDNYEAGLTQKLCWDMELDLALFQSDVEDYIEKDNNGLSVNNEEYQFRGFEARLTKQILDHGSVGVSYSLLKTKDKSPGTLKDELQYRPKHKYVVDATYSWDFGLTAHADIMHVADQYYYSDAFDKGKLKDYTIVNLKLEQALYKDMLSVYAGVDNLFDEQYEESYGYPQSGRTLYAGINMKF